ncbi:hypothetical protein CHS0354_031365 [Potamilus streckersoni]|uniref:Caspase-3 n=1 Tax=Potamilus streckersoni TaxID=2493646 RepID=A0AAE0SKP0_9BIVA|nr:hypothetical protein CHS0354_031365 [Potamilus streckersoni]
MTDSHIKMDIRKETEENQTSNAKDCKVQDSHGKSCEEAEEKPDLFPFYHYKDHSKGKIVIVVNETFENQPKLQRKGAEKDPDYLKYVFLDKLGFEQLNKKKELNLKQEDLETVLEETAGRVYNDTDFFVFAVSTHGEERPNKRYTEQYEHALMCSDEKYVFTTDIIDRFSKIPSLAGKPKIFFIQACRIPYDTDSKEDPRIYDPGHDYNILIEAAKEESVTKTNDLPESEICGLTEEIHTVTKKVDKCSLTENNDKGHIAQDNVESGHRSENNQTTKPSSQDKADAAHRSENEGTSQPAPDDQGQGSVQFLSSLRCPKDCLVVYAIQSGKMAWRSEGNGSWMFHQLYEVVRNNKQTSFVDFFDVLTKTAFGMAQRESNTGVELSHGQKAVPIIQHRLTKHLFIPLRK